jgi:hypothetical protein
MTAQPLHPRETEVVDATRRWLKRAVIGLNLCPFARPVASAGRIRFAVSSARCEQALLADLAEELLRLARADPAEQETTLLIHPDVLGDFLAFNDFLASAEAAVETLGLSGVLQVASFHPHYQFAGTAPGDVENCTNRAPFPTLHLLRESSVERAVGSMADPASIYRRNIETLRRLGHEGWERLMGEDVACATGPADAARRAENKR